MKTDDNRALSDNSKKAMILINLMKQHKELALKARKMVHFFGRQAEVGWSSGCKDLVEWNERKVDDIC